MPDTPTPGQTCYAAYSATLPYAESWTDLSAAAHARWEAAAQAVRAMQSIADLTRRLDAAPDALEDDNDA
jgi:hypothetical protein